MYFARRIPLRVDDALYKSLLLLLRPRRMHGVWPGVEDSLSVIPHLWDWVTEAECKRSENVNAQIAAVKKKEKKRKKEKKKEEKKDHLFLRPSARWPSGKALGW